MGDLEDAAALLQAAVSAGKVPREVLLEINPMLSHPFGEERGVLTASYLEAIRRYGVPLHWRFLLRLLWFGTARRNLQREPGWGIWHEGMTQIEVRPDGSITRPDHQTPAELARLVKEQVEEIDFTDWKWRRSSTPSLWDQRLLSRFLDDLQAHGVRTTVLFLPVHPMAFDVYSRQGGYHEEWLRHEFSRRGIPVVGSYSPAAVNARAEDFYDSVHPKPDLLRRIVQGGAHEYRASGAP
jgi:hypothetical protein